MNFKTSNNLLFRILFFSISVFLLSSCITSKKINYLQEPSGRIPAYKNEVGYKEYTLVPFDKLYIKIYSPDEKINFLINGNMDGNSMDGASAQTDLYSHIINEEGKIRLPIIGDIRLDGLYIREAKKVIEQSIKSYIIDDCAVDVQLVQRYFSVIGGGINGRFPIQKEKMNIFQVLALCGDINTFGDRGNIKILRESPEGIQIKNFDIRSKDIINSEFYYIQPNDVIYIQELKSQFFSVTSFSTVFSTLTSSVSLGLLIYNYATQYKAEKTD